MKIVEKNINEQYDALIKDITNFASANPKRNQFCVCELNQVMIDKLHLEGFTVYRENYINYIIKWW